MLIGWIPPIFCDVFNLSILHVIAEEFENFWSQYYSPQEDMGPTDTLAGVKREISKDRGTKLVKEMKEYRRFTSWGRGVDYDFVFIFWL